MPTISAQIQSWNAESLSFSPKQQRKSLAISSGQSVDIPLLVTARSSAEIPKEDHKGSASSKRSSVLLGDVGEIDADYLAKLPRFVAKHRFRGQKVLRLR